MRYLYWIQIIIFAFSKCKVTLKKKNIYTLCDFPLNERGKIVGYEDETLTMPRKIIEMGLLPDTHFVILYQAPFSGPLYVEFGSEKSRIALREEEAKFILVEPLEV